jgi:hypothetical protein
METFPALIKTEGLPLTDWLLHGIHTNGPVRRVSPRSMPTDIERGGREGAPGSGRGAVWIPELLALDGFWGTVSARTCDNS